MPSTHKSNKARFPLSRKCHNLLRVADAMKCKYTSVFENLTYIQDTKDKPNKPRLFHINNSDLITIVIRPNGNQALDPFPHACSYTPPFLILAKGGDFPVSRLPRQSLVTINIMHNYAYAAIWADNFSLAANARGYVFCTQVTTFVCFLMWTLLNSGYTTL